MQVLCGQCGCEIQYNMISSMKRLSFPKVSSRQQAGAIAGKQSYVNKILNIRSANLIGYWPLTEGSGTNADNAEGTSQKDGTFARNVSTMGTEPGIASDTSPSFDGTNDVVDIYSAELNSGWDGDNGSLSLWIKRRNWDNASIDFAFTIQVDASNQIYLRTTATDGTVEATFESGGTGVIRPESGLSSDTWYHFAIVWGGGTASLYRDGVEVGSEWAIGTWVGSLVNTATVIGAANTTPALAHDGSIAHVALWNAKLTQSEISDLASP